MRTLQHTATHYNTLQHVSAYHKVGTSVLNMRTLQHTATHFNTLQHVSAYHKVGTSVLNMRQQSPAQTKNLGEYYE